MSEKQKQPETFIMINDTSQLSEQYDLYALGHLTVIPIEN